MVYLFTLYTWSTSDTDDLWPYSTIYNIVRSGVVSVFTTAILLGKNILYYIYWEGLVVVNTRIKRATTKAM